MQSRTKKWDEVYKEIVSRYENVKESQETLTFQEYCLKQWMRKNGVELKICKITDAKVQNYLDEQAKNNAKIIRQKILNITLT